MGRGYILLSIWPSFVHNHAQKGAGLSDTQTLCNKETGQSGPSRVLKIYLYLYIYIYIYLYIIFIIPNVSAVAFLLSQCPLSVYMVHVPSTFSALPINLSQVLLGVVIIQFLPATERQRGRWGTREGAFPNLMSFCLQRMLQSF